MNSNTETPNTITLPQALFDLEGEAGYLAIEMQNVQAVLSFLGEFFEGEELDPNAEDPAKHSDAVYRIWRYPAPRKILCKSPSNQTVARITGRAEDFLVFAPAPKDERVMRAVRE